MVSGLTFKSLINFELTFEGPILFSSLKKKKPLCPVLRAFYCLPVRSCSLNLVGLRAHIQASCSIHVRSSVTVAVPLQWVRRPQLRGPRRLQCISDVGRGFQAPGSALWLLE